MPPQSYTELQVSVQIITRPLTHGSGMAPGGRPAGAGCLFTLEGAPADRLAWSSLPGRLGAQRSGASPEAGPSLQDAHAQGPEAVIGQRSSNSVQRVICQALPHGGPGRQARLRRKPAGLLMGPARKRRCRGTDGNPARDAGFSLVTRHGSPSQCLQCWEQRSVRRPSLSGPWIQLELLDP